MFGTQDIGMFVIAATQVLTLVALFAKLTGKPERRELSPQPFSVRPDLDPSEKFSAISHMHADMLSKGEHDKLCDRRAEQIVRLERSIEDIREMFQAGMASYDVKAEDRARRLHARVDSLVTPLNQLIGKFDNHMESHRKRGDA